MEETSRDKTATGKGTDTTPFKKATTDLKSALESWNQLAKEKLPPSADEQMLQDVQKLLQELQNKMKDLDL